jgi:hypothetical protein
MPLDNSTDYDPRDLAVTEAFITTNFREDVAITDVPSTGVWLARQLDVIKARTYDRLFPAMNAGRLVPDDTSTPEWAETITIRMFDQVGMAKVISNYADDLPRVDVRGADKTVTVKTLGDSYGFNVNELRASRATGVGLDQRKADMARRAMELKINSIKLQGDADYGLFGLFSHPNIPEFIMTTPGDWTGLTGDQIYANLNNMAVAYTLQSTGIHVATALLLAPKAFAAASSKFVTGPSGMPVPALSMFRANYSNITVENVWECQAAKNGKDVALMYERSGDNLAHEYVMPFTQLPPQADNLEIIVNCLARTAGVQVYYPLSLLFGFTT